VVLPPLAATNRSLARAAAGCALASTRLPTAPSATRAVDREALANEYDADAAVRAQRSSSASNAAAEHACGTRWYLCAQRAPRVAA
jgi:hypothetical protein